jgi:hypothetical protein
MRTIYLVEPKKRLLDPNAKQQQQQQQQKTPVK